MKNENIPADKLLRHIKFRLIEHYIYNRFRAHGYEVDPEFIGEPGDARWINLKTGMPFTMLLTELGIELRQDQEHEAASDRMFVQQLITEGIFAPVGGGLLASYTQSLDMLLLATREHLDDTQLLRCVRSKPCVDRSWLERGYVTN